MDWKPIETAPKDGTSFKATHSNAAEQSLKFTPNCFWDGAKFVMSSYPISKDGRFLITGPPDLWLPNQPNEVK